MAVQWRVREVCRQTERKRTQVSMPRDGTTQTRTFTYDATTQRHSSTTNPENGTVSYVYNNDGTLQKKTDAKNQHVEYTYDNYQRVTQIKRFRADNSEDVCQQVNFVYDTPEPGFSQYTWGRLVKQTWGGTGCSGGALTHIYSYTQAGLATKKKLKVDRGQPSPVLDATGQWAYDNEGRNTSVTYPSGAVYEWNDARGDDTLAIGLFVPGYADYAIVQSRMPALTIDQFISGGTKAASAPAGSALWGNICFDSSYVSRLSTADAAALLMHEVMHTLGANDPTILKALGFDPKQVDNGTIKSGEITAKLSKDCFQ